MKYLSATAEIEVPFQDLDPMEVVWHGNYFRYFETARAQLLRSIDYDYPQMHEAGFAWPIVDTRVKFIQPARYAQVLAATARLEEWENRLKISYDIRDANDGTQLTRGFTIQCAVCLETGELQFVTPLALRERIESRLESLR